MANSSQDLVQNNHRKSGFFAAATLDIPLSRFEVNLLRFIVPLAMAGLATLLRILLTPWLGDSAPFLFYFLATFLVGLWVGRAGALFSVILSLGFSTFFFFPEMLIGQSSNREIIRTLLFFTQNLAIGLLAGSFRNRRLALEKREKLLSSIIENLPGVLYLKNAKGQFVLGNTQFENLLKKPMSEIVGLSDLDLFSKELAERYMTNDQLVIQERRRMAFEETDFGGERIYTSYKFPIFDKTGELQYVCGISVDMTEQKHAQLSLLERERAFHAIANSIPQMAWMAEPNGSLTWFNDRWYDYTGTDFEHMRGWGWKAVHHPDHVQRVIKSWEKAIISQPNWEQIFPLRSKSGEWRWFLSRALPIADEGGQVVKWFGTNTDITDRLKMEEDLAKSQERLSLALKAARMGTFDWDIETDKHIWSNHTGVLFGHDAGYQLESFDKLVEQIHPDDRELVRKTTDYHLRFEKEYETKYRIIKPDGDISWVAIRGQPIHEQGKLKRLVGVCWDCTQEQKFEESLLKAKDLAEAANRAKSKFVKSLNENEFTESAPSNAQDQVGLPLSGKKILVVDDSHDNRDVISKYLQGSGANVELAENGREGFDLARQSVYDFVLMDIQMPIMDGEEATMKLRSHGYQGPIIAVTAHAMKGDRERALNQVGFDDYLTKPLDRKLLIDRLFNLVRSDRETN